MLKGKSLVYLYYHPIFLSPVFMSPFYISCHFNIQITYLHPDFFFITHRLPMCLPIHRQPNSSPFSKQPQKPSQGLSLIHPYFSFRMINIYILFGNHTHLSRFDYRLILKLGNQNHIIYILW